MTKALCFKIFDIEFSYVSIPDGKSILNVVSNAFDAMFSLICDNFQQFYPSRDIIGFLYIKMLAYYSVETL